MVPRQIWKKVNGTNKLNKRKYKLDKNFNNSNAKAWFKYDNMFVLFELN